MAPTGETSASTCGRSSFFCFPGNPLFCATPAVVIEAMKVTHTSTKTGVIIRALEELVRKSKISDLKKFKGKIDIDINLDEIRDRH